MEGNRSAAETLRPRGDRVVVTPKPRDETTRSGIVQPDTASEKPQEGTVVSVGPGRRLESGERVHMEVRQGDTVPFTRYGSTEVKLEDENDLVIRGSDLLAVIRNGRNDTEDNE
jgi:chaperonin GroES